MISDALFKIQGPLLQIWSEQNFKSCLKKLIQLVHSLEPINAVSFFDYDQSRKLLFSQFSKVADEFLKKAELLKKSNLDKLSLLEISERVFYFDFESGFLLLEFTEEPKSMDLLEFCFLQTASVLTWQKKSSEAEKLVYRDDLTGVFGYRYLQVALEQELKRYARFESPFSIIFFDLDGFKQVNDQYGHLAGSEVLKQISLVTLSCVRDIDIVIRYGGDEFVVLLIGTTQIGAQLVAERLRSQIEKHIFKITAQLNIQITASLGIATCPLNTQSKEQLIHMADSAMYESKHSGKNKISLAKKGVLPNATQTAER